MRLGDHRLQLGDIVDLFEVDTQGVKDPRRDTLSLAHQSKQHVLGSDVVVTEHPGLLLREDHYAPGPIGEALVHRGISSASRLRLTKPTRAATP